MTIPQILAVPALALGFYRLLARPKKISAFISMDYIALLKDYESGCSIDISQANDAPWDLNMLALLYRGRGIKFAETWTWQRQEGEETWRPL